MSAMAVVRARTAASAAQQWHMSPRARQPPVPRHPMSQEGPPSLEAGAPLPVRACRAPKAHPQGQKGGRQWRIASTTEGCCSGIVASVSGLCACLWHVAVMPRVIVRHPATGLELRAAGKPIRPLIGASWAPGRWRRYIPGHPYHRTPPPGPGPRFLEAPSATLRPLGTCWPIRHAHAFHARSRRPCALMK